MMRLMRKCRGSISVLLICIMLPMVVFECLLIDSSKLIVAKSAASDAGDLAMNGALADYNTVVQDVYGLFSMSSSEEELQANVEQYFKETLNASGIDEEALKDAVTFLNLTAEISGEQVEGSQLSDPNVMESQIAQYMKYRGLASMTTGLLDKFTAFSSLPKQQKVMEDKINYDNKLSDVQDSLSKAYKKIQECLNSNFVDASELGTVSSLVNTNYEYVSRSLVYNKYVENKGYSSETCPRDSKMAEADVSADEVEEAELKAFIDAVYADYQADTSNYSTWKTAMESNANVILTENNQAAYTSLDAIDAGWSDKTFDTTLTNEQYMKKLLIYWEAYCDLKGESNVDSELRSFMDDVVKKDIEKYDLPSLCEAYQNFLTTSTQAIAESVHNVLDSKNSRMESCIQSFDKAKDALEDAKKDAEKADELKEKWKNHTDELDDGDVKTSMKSEVENRTEGLDTDALDSLVTVLSDIQAEYESCQSKLKEISFFDTKLYNYENSNYFDSYQTHVETYSTITNVEQTVSEVKNNLNNPSLSVDAEKVKKEKITDNKFYKYLAKICTAEESENEDSNKDTAKEQKKNALDGAKLEAFVPRAGLDDNSYPDISVAEGDLQEVERSNSNNKKVTNSAMKMSKETVSGLKKLGEILATGRNTLFLEEYVTEMFSCYTTQDTECSLSGNCFKTSTLIPSKNYQSEVEYILFGKSKPSDNVAAARNRIFAIRFVLNLIYAYTGDAEIKAETLAIATAIAGWTGFGVPIVQNVLIIAFALTESIIDTTRIMDGEDVVIYKSPTTWSFKLSGIGRSAGELAVEAANKGVDAAAKKVNDLISEASADTQMKIDELEGNLEKLVEDKTDALVESAISSVFTPIQSMTLSVIPDVNVSDEQISSKVDEIFHAVQESVGAAEGEQINTQVMTWCMEYMKNTYKTQVVNAIISVRNKVGLEGESTSTILKERFQEIQSDLTAKLTEKVKNSEYMKAFKDEMKSLAGEVNSQVQNAEGKAKEVVDENVAKLKGKMNDKIASWSQGLGSSDEAVARKTELTKNNKTSPSKAVALTMNYKEYLKLFTLIGLFVNKPDMMKRIGILIEYNAQNSSNEEAKKFTLSNAYTMVKVDAEVSVQTSFMRNIASTIGQSNPSFLDSEGKYTFQYKGVLGY